MEDLENLYLTNTEYPPKFKPNFLPSVHFWPRLESSLPPQKKNWNFSCSNFVFDQHRITHSLPIQIQNLTFLL